MMIYFLSTRWTLELMTHLKGALEESDPKLCPKSPQWSKLPWLAKAIPLYGNFKRDFKAPSEMNIYYG